MPASGRPKAPVFPPLHGIMLNNWLVAAV